MIAVFFLFVLAFFMSYALTPMSAMIATKLGAVDFPDPEGGRKIHKKPIPYGGGIAIFLSFFIVLGIGFLIPDARENIHIDLFKIIGLFVASFIVFLMGFYDDIKPTKAVYKLFFQIIAAAVLVLSGFEITHLTDFFGGGGQISLGALSIPITLIWIVGVTNTINLIDGLDGLAAGVCSIASVTVFIIATITGNHSLAVLAAILAGSCAGFLPRNFNPAKIFMGDSGAYFLGMLLAVISMESGLKSATTLAVIAPIITIGLPIFDTIFAIVRRFFSGRPISIADKGHIHHKFLGMGIGQKRAVLAMYMINALFGIGAVAVISGDWPYGIAFVAIAFILMVIPMGFGIDNSTAKNILYNDQDLALGPKVLFVFGTRPEANKLAPVINALKQYDGINTLVCVTGQHREQLDSMLKIFNIVPDYDLELMRHGQTLAQISSGTISGVDFVLEACRPDMVVVHGDPSSSFISALAAFYKGIPVAHVEAGLRSGDISSPFPEEFNRIAISKIASFHFAATEHNRFTLLAEGVRDEDIIVTGNTVIDALNFVVDDGHSFKSQELRLAMDKMARSRLILMTAHRRENLGDNMSACFRALRRIADDFEDVFIIYPVHLNPAVRLVAEDVLSNHERIALISPLDYKDMANLMARSYLVVTDSGGIQEEAPSLGKPVVLMRKETERQEAIEAGTVVLAGVEEADVYNNVARLLSSQEEYNKMASSKNPYGDGNSGKQIADFIFNHFIINQNGYKETHEADI